MALPVEIERLRRRLAPPPPSGPPLEVQRAAAQMRAADAAAQPGARTWTDPEVRPGIRLPPELPTPAQQADIGATRLVETIPPAPPGSGPAGARRILSTTAPTVGPNIPQGMPTRGSPGPGGLLEPNGIIQSSRPLQAPLDFNAPLPTASVPKPVSAQMELPLGPPSGPNPPVALPQPSPTLQTGANFAERMARPAPPLPPRNPFAERIARPAPPPASAMPAPPFSGTLRMVAKAAPYVSAGLTVADVVRRATTSAPVEQGQWDMLDTLATRGLGASEAGNIVRDQFGGNPQDNNLVEARKNIAEMAASRQNMQQDRAESRGRDPYDRLVDLGLKGDLSRVTRSSSNTSTESRPAPTPLEAGPMPVTPKLTSLGNGYGVTGEGANRTYYGPSANVVASAQPIAGLRGGFVGAETDAQAAKALQDRAEQNQAAQFNINSMNRGAEAERDLRATRLGVSRGVLDRMEGRNDTEAAVAAAAAQSAPTSGQFNPLSMPGDSLYDTRSRQATYDSAIQQALSGNKQEQKGAAATLTALNDFREKNLAAQVAQSKDQTGVNPVDMDKFLLDQEKFKQTQNTDANRFLLDKERFNYQQGLDKERLTVDRNEAEGKQAERQLTRQKYMDESRKAFVNEFAFSDPKAPREQIAGAVFDISQATSVPPDVVSQFYEQAVKDLKIDYGKGGPKDPMALNKLVAARITQAYQGQ